LQRQYWKFYWPLALTSLVQLIGTQAQNGVLASYDEIGRELAIFALASSVFFFFCAALVFVPHMANVLGRSAPARGACLRFTILASLALTVPAAVLAFTNMGQTALSQIFHIQDAELAEVTRYLRLLLPLMLINGLRNHYTGLLVQAHLTGTVTTLYAVNLGVNIVSLAGGLMLGWSAVVTVAIAIIFSALVHLVATFMVYVLRYRSPDDGLTTELTWREILSFFWPVATTSLMFALSRPVLYAFVNRTAQAVVLLAGIRVAFDFAMLFHAPINQFRHFLVTFGESDPAGSRRFMGRIMLALTGIMGAIAFTPLSTFVLRNLLQVRGQALEIAGGAMMVLCGTPLIITIRNYFHGVLLTRRRTHGMAIGGIARVLTIYVSSWAFFEAGLLNRLTAAGVLLAGFGSEAIISAIFARLSKPTSPSQAELA